MTKELETLIAHLALLMPTQIKAHYNYLRRINTATTQQRIQSPGPSNRCTTSTNSNHNHPQRI